MEVYIKQLNEASNGFNKTTNINQAENTNADGFPQYIWDCGKKFRFQKVTSTVQTRTIPVRRLRPDGTIVRTLKTVSIYWDVKARYVQCHAFTRADHLTVTRKEAYLLAHIPTPSRTCRYL